MPKPSEAQRSPTSCSSPATFGPLKKQAKPPILTRGEAYSATTPRCPTALERAIPYLSLRSRARASDLMQATSVFPRRSFLAISSRIEQFLPTLSTRVTFRFGLHMAQTIPGSPPPVPTSATWPISGAKAREKAQSLTWRSIISPGSRGPVNLAFSLKEDSIRANCSSLSLFFSISLRAWAEERVLNMFPSSTIVKSSADPPLDQGSWTFPSTYLSSFI